ncbi:MAG: class I SAM-dependent rRNA methyltransferase [Verrucomicrobia bacterium]|jgi:23S rRNA (cytosine1962-C5)-methyltransferase|nr:class I SAM-dependent rRNA methyltransferase [Verrucomicrobiota bacterium]
MTAASAHSTPPGSPTLRLRVSRVAEARIRGGHPWVFSDSVRETNRPGRDGELAVLYDRNDRFLAVGLFDSTSPIQVRILHRGKPCTIDESWFGRNLARALQARASLFDSGTNGYRLINGESDGWPALVVDRYNTTLVLKLYSVAWLQRLEMLQSLLVRGPAPERIVLRLSRNIQDAAGRDFGRADGDLLFGPPVDAPPVFLENGIRFEVDVVRGQKTGFFLDQRENRERIAKVASGRRVLNAFSFSGGFSLYAARGGARVVTDLDISSHALEQARCNWGLNAGEPWASACAYEAVQADAFEWLGGRSDRQFDLIVLDPPSLARRESERAGAIAAYQRLATDAIRWLADGGILFAASCSAHVTAEEFFEAVRKAARAGDRRATELETTGHALDHPATFPEAQYLKGIYLRF